MALTSASQFAVWFTAFIVEIQFPMEFPVPILGDNTSAITTCETPETSRYARHIDLRMRFVTQMRDASASTLKRRLRRQTSKRLPRRQRPPSRV